MTNILDKIIANKRLEVERHKKDTPINELEKRLSTITTPASFKEAIKNSRTGIIAEFMRRSTSRDWNFLDAKIGVVIPL